MEEKITVKIPLSHSDISLAFGFAGEDLTPEMWEKVKGMNHEINFTMIEDKAERMQIKIGIAALLLANLPD
ncbi:MAG: hypothetical protein HDS50_04890 [Bacteroides sp.]|nr:hypothetical protein [Bacteroides sp.]